MFVCWRRDVVPCCGVGEEKGSSRFYCCRDRREREFIYPTAFSVVFNPIWWLVEIFAFGWWNPNHLRGEHFWRKARYASCWRKGTWQVRLFAAT